MSKEKLYAKTDEAKAVLKKMAAKAADIESQKAELEKLSAALGACWKGTSSNAMQEKLAALIKEHGAIARELKENAETMRRELQQLEDEDRALAEAIRVQSLAERTIDGFVPKNSSGGFTGSSGRGSSGGGRQV